MTTLIETIKDNSKWVYASNSEVYEALVGASDEYMLAFLSTIHDKYGNLTEEQARELEQEIYTYTLTESFQRAFKVNQIKGLLSSVEVSVKGILYLLEGSERHTEDALNMMLSTIELDYDKDTFKDLLNRVLVDLEKKL